MTRKLLRKTLASINVTYSEAENGRVAVDRIARGETFAVILMDKEMVRREGLRVMCLENVGGGHEEVDEVRVSRYVR